MKSICTVGASFIFLMLLGYGKEVNAQFDPPRIIYVDSQTDQGTLPDSLAMAWRYYIDKGNESGIARGLNSTRKCNFGLDCKKSCFLV